jgi:hypothetical protein
MLSVDIKVIPDPHNSDEIEVRLTMKLSALGAGKGERLDVEEQLARQLNALAQRSMQNVLQAYDSDGSVMMSQGTKWTSKGQTMRVVEPGSCNRRWVKGRGVGETRG